MSKLQRWKEELQRSQFESPTMPHMPLQVRVKNTFLEITSDGDAGDPELAVQPALFRSWSTGRLAPAKSEPTDLRANEPLTDLTGRFGVGSSTAPTQGFAVPPAPLSPASREPCALPVAAAPPPLTAQSETGAQGTGSGGSAAWPAREAPQVPAMEEAKDQPGAEDPRVASLILLTAKVLDMQSTYATCDNNMAEVRDGQGTLMNQLYQYKDVLADGRSSKEGDGTTSAMPSSAMMGLQAGADASTTPSTDMAGQRTSLDFENAWLMGANQCVDSLLQDMRNLQSQGRDETCAMLAAMMAQGGTDRTWARFD